MGEFQQVSSERYDELYSMRRKVVDDVYSVKYGPHDLMDQLIQDLAEDKGFIHQDDMLKVKNEILRIVDPGQLTDGVHVGEADLSAGCKRNCGLLRYMQKQFQEEFSSIFDLVVQQTGSVAEGTKVGEPDEFDFAFILKHKTEIEPFHLTLTQNNQTDISTEYFESKTPCELTILELYKDQITSQFVTGDSKLHPRKIIDFFHSCLETYFEGALVTQRGPSRNIYIRISGLKNICKLDFCLMMEASKPMVDAFLRKRGSGISDIINQSDSLHVICCGGFWKISACLPEVLYIQTQLDPYYKKIYKILKVLRGHYENITGLEDPQLSSYALKVALINYSLEAKEEVVTEMSIYTDILNILLKIDNERNGFCPLSSVSIENEPIFKPNDTSYLQARQIAVNLRDLESQITLHGSFHTIFVLIFSISILLELTPNPEMKFYTTVTFFGIIPTIAIVGMLWILVEHISAKQKLSKTIKTGNLIFKRQWWLFGFYLLDILQIAVGFSLMLYGRCATGFPKSWNLEICQYASVSAWIAFLFMGISVILFIIKTKCHLKKFRWQWVFSHHLFKSYLCSYTCCKSFLFRRSVGCQMNVLTPDAYQVALKETRADIRKIFKCDHGKHQLFDSIEVHKLRRNPSVMTNEECDIPHITGFEALLESLNLSHPWKQYFNSEFTIKCMSHYQRSDKLKECNILITAHGHGLHVTQTEVQCMNKALMPKSYCKISHNNFLVDNHEVLKWFKEMLKNHFQVIQIKNSKCTLLFENKRYNLLRKINVMFGFEVSENQVQTLEVQNKWWKNQQKSSGAFVLMCEKLSWRLSPLLLASVIEKHAIFEDRVLLQCQKAMLNNCSITHDFEDLQLSMTALSSVAIDMMVKGSVIRDDVFVNSLNLFSEISGTSLNTQNTSTDDLLLTSRSTAKCPFIAEDPLFGESDRSFLFSRDLAVRLRQFQRRIFIHGAWFTYVIILIYLIASLDFWLHLFDVITFHMIISIILSSINLMISGICLLLLMLLKLCIKERYGLYNVISPLYDNVAIPFLYFTCIMSFSVAIIIVASIYLSLPVTQTCDPDCHLDPSSATSADKLTYLTYLFQACLVLFQSIYFIVYFCLSKCQLKSSRWQWVFIDSLCYNLGVNEEERGMHSPV